MTTFPSQLVVPALVIAGSYLSTFFLDSPATIAVIGLVTGISYSLLVMVWSRGRPSQIKVARERRFDKRQKTVLIIAVVACGIATISVGYLFYLIRPAYPGGRDIPILSAAMIFLSSFTMTIIVVAVGKIVSLLVRK